MSINTWESPNTWISGGGGVVVPVFVNHYKMSRSTMIILKQSTSSQAILIGPFVDDTDGKTAETGLTIANTDIRLSKNGANIAAKNSGGGTHDELGYYTITLDATDTSTVGVMQIMCTMSGALPVYHNVQILEEAVYDALYASSAGGYNTVTPPTVAELNARTLPSADYFDPAADVVANVTLVDTCTANTDMVGTDNALLASNYTAADNASITTILADTNELQLNQGNWITATGFSTHSAADVYTEFTSGSNEDVFKADVSGLASQASLDVVDSNVDAILLDTNELQLNQGDWITADVSGLASQASLDIIDSNVDAILVDTNELQLDWTGDGRLDTILNNVASDVGDLPNFGNIQSMFTEIKGATWSASTDTLEAIRDRGDTAWTTGAGGSSPTVEQIRTEMDTNSTKFAAILTDTNELQGNIVVVNTHLTDMQGEGFLSGTDSLESIRNRGDLAWTTGAGGSSPTVEQIRAEIDSNSTQLAIIAADTNELQLNQGDWITADVSGLATQASLDVVDSNVDAILVDTNELQTNQGNWITATGFSTHSAADVDTLLTTEHGPGSWTSGIGGAAVDANILSVNGVVVTDIEDFKLDIETVVLENSETLGETLRLMRSEAVGATVVSGTTINFKSADGTKNRISETADSNGNRSGIITDGTL